LGGGELVVCCDAMRITEKCRGGDSTRHAADGGGGKATVVTRKVAGYGKTIKT